MRNFKIGVMTDSFRTTFVDALDKAKELGAQGVQMYVTEGDMFYKNLTDERIEQAKRELADRGLVVSAICGDFGGHGFETEAENEWKIPSSKLVADLAVRFGAPVVTTHIGVVPEDNTCETYQRMKAACRELGDYAASVGVTFAIETGPEKPETLAAFIRDVGSKGIGVNLDPANLVMVTGCDPVAAVYTLKDFIVHTHAKDGVMLQQADTHKVYNYFSEGGIGDLRLDEYFKELPLGDGDVPFDKYLDALEDIGYSGFLTVERECGADPYADIKRAVDYLKSNINA